MEDEIFADFCSSIGVTNIRQYEERELRAQQDRAKKRLDFENQKSRLLNQLEFEQSRDTEGELKFPCISDNFCDEDNNIKYLILMFCLTYMEHGY